MIHVQIDTTELTDLKEFFKNHFIFNEREEKQMTDTFTSQLNYERLPADSVTTEMLDIIGYGYAGQRDIEITIQQPEFTSICPMTGLPDFGSITITFTPDRNIVELKSLKFYFLQYRNVGIFYEHLVNQILNDLSRQLKPKKMKIIGNFTARGGITTTVTALYERSPNDA
jgi:7-cyano-7-deazaguanine reductase